MSTDRVLSPRRRENRPKGPERAQARTSTGGEFIRKALNPCGNRDGIATHAANVDAHAELSRDCYQHRCRGREVNPFVRIKIDGFAPNRAPSRADLRVPRPAAAPCTPILPRPTARRGADRLEAPALMADAIWLPVRSFGQGSAPGGLPLSMIRSRGIARALARRARETRRPSAKPIDADPSKLITIQMCN